MPSLQLPINSGFKPDTEPFARLVPTERYGDILAFKDVIEDNAPAITFRFSFNEGDALASASMSFAGQWSAEEATLTRDRALDDLEASHVEQFLSHIHQEIRERNQADIELRGNNEAPIARIVNHEVGGQILLTVEYDADDNRFLMGVRCQTDGILNLWLVEHEHRGSMAQCRDDMQSMDKGEALDLVNTCLFCELEPPPGTRLQ